MHDYSKYKLGKTYYVVTMDYGLETHSYFFEKYEDALEYAENFKPKDDVVVWLSSWEYKGEPFKESNVKTLRKWISNWGGWPSFRHYYLKEQILSK